MFNNYLVIIYLNNHLIINYLTGMLRIISCGPWTGGRRGGTGLSTPSGFPIKKNVEKMLKKRKTLKKR